MMRVLAEIQPPMKLRQFQRATQYPISVRRRRQRDRGGGMFARLLSWAEKCVYMLHEGDFYGHPLVACGYPFSSRVAGWGSKQNSWTSRSTLDYSCWHLDK